MNCEKIQELIPELVLKGLPSDTEKMVLAHLTICPICKKEAAKQKNLTAGLKNFFLNLDTGNKPFVFPPSQEVSLWQGKPWLIWGSALTFALSIGFFFLIPMFLTPTFQESGRSVPEESLAYSQTFLRTGTLQDLVTQKTWQKDASLPQNTSFQAIEESTLNHLSRVFFTLAEGSRFGLTRDGIALDYGGGQFSVQPGSENVQIQTPAGTIGVLGTEFEVLASPELTMVFLTRGKVNITSEKGTLMMEPQEAVLVNLGSPPRKVVISETPMTFLQMHPKDWETTLKERFFSRVDELKESQPVSESPPVALPLPVATSSVEDVAPLPTQTDPIATIAVSDDIVIDTPTFPDQNNPEEAMDGDL